MKKITIKLALLFAVGIVCATFQVGAQQTKQAHADAPALSDKAKLEVQSEVLALTQIQIQSNALAQEYQNRMRNDERFKKLDEATKEHQARLNGLLDASKKELKVADGLVFDLDSLGWVKPQPSPTPKAN